jgi:trypsin
MLRLTLLCAAVAVASAIPAPGKHWEGDCGESSYSDAGREQLEKSMIVGGWESRQNEFPWQVSLLWLGSHFCGGSLIDSTHVLTAAHCVEGDNPSRLQVRVGEHLRNSPNEYTRTVAVVGNSWHPRYDQNGNLEFDFAVLELAEAVSFDDGSQPVCAPVKDDEAYDGEDATVSGWGTLSSGGSVTNELRYVNVPILSSSRCASSFPNGWVSDDMVCAGNQGGNDRDACQGDSGGPLVVRNSAGRFEIVGIVSWGLGCATVTPGVYSEVFYEMDWINAQH